VCGWDSWSWQLKISATIVKITGKLPPTITKNLEKYSRNFTFAPLAAHSSTNIHACLAKPSPPLSLLKRIELFRGFASLFFSFIDGEKSLKAHKKKRKNFRISFS
jgi:hypothetical protein